MTRHLPLVLAALVCAGFTLAPAGEAQAQTKRRKFGEKIGVKQRKPVLRKGRFELEPTIGYSINDSVYNSFKAGLGGTLYLSESFSLRGSFDWYNFGETLGGPMAAFERVVEEANANTDSPFINWAGALELGWTPVFGKASLFNSGLLYYTMTVSAGPAFVNSQSILLPTPQSGLGATFAVRSNLFFNRWFSLNLGVRDTIYNTALLNSPDAKSLSHTVCMEFGFGFYIPSSFEYTEIETSDTIVEQKKGR